MQHPAFARGELLFHQNRADLAEPELRRCLIDDPDHARAHALLALCLAEREKYKEATSEAQRAIALAPDDGYAHYGLSIVLAQRHRFRQAKASAEEAIRLEPWEPAYFAQLAHVLLALGDSKGSLAAADQGLVIDPENVACQNVRATALVQLGDRAGASRTIASAMARDPDNAYTHANVGWALLHEGKPKDAMIHFREALRLEPDFQWARVGIVEAMKARNFLYRWLLAYFLWTSRIGAKTGMALVIGAVVLMQVMDRLDDARPDLRPITTPLFYAYVAFAFVTWMGNSFFNLLLRFDPFGRLVLSPEQIRGANCIAVCLFGGLLGALMWLSGIRALEALGILVLAVSFAMMIPVGATFACQPGWPRMLMGTAAILLALLGVGIVAYPILVDLIGLDAKAHAPSFSRMVDVFKWGIVGTTWAGLFLGQVTPKR